MHTKYYKSSVHVITIIVYTPLITVTANMIQFTAVGCIRVVVQKKKARYTGLIEQRRATMYCQAVIVLMLVYTHVLVSGELPSAQTLPWFTYSGNVENLAKYLSENVPVGHRNIFLLAQNITIKSDIKLKSSSYYEQQMPFVVTIVCETLEVSEPEKYQFDSQQYHIDLSGNNAPNYVSSAPSTVLYQPIVDPWTGKKGENGGSIYIIYAKHKRGRRQIAIDVSGGNGGKGQDGRQGNNGKPPTFLNPAVNGEDGGDGASGGRGGSAGEVVIKSMDSPSTIAYQINPSGGSGGQGGSGGHGGQIVSSQTWLRALVSFPDGVPGKDGYPGVRGNSGKQSIPDEEHTSDEDTFFGDIPITGSYLQRALNVEMIRMDYARYLSGSHEWRKVKHAVMWLRDIAEAHGYDLVQKRCSDMLKICEQLQNKRTLSTRIYVQKSAIRAHLDILQQVAEQSVNINPSQFNNIIQTDQLLKSHSKFAREIHYLARHYSTSIKERYYNVIQLATKFSGTYCINEQTQYFVTATLSSKLVEKISAIAGSKPYIKEALSGTGPVEVYAATVVQALLELTEAEPLLGFLGGKRVVEPIVESAVLEIMGRKVISEVQQAWSSLFNGLSEEIARCERIVQAHADKHYSYDRTARVIKDEKLRKVLHPTNREPYLRPGRKNRRPDPPPSPWRPTIPKPKEQSGKCLGVLDKQEVVESNTNLVVVTLDAITMYFSVEPGEVVDLNNLDSYQTEQFYSQLERYRLPSSSSPAFIITTIINGATVSKDTVGEWFEFDCKFGEGTGTAVEVSSILI